MAWSAGGGRHMIASALSGGRAGGADRLTEVASILPEPCARIERDFVEMGDRLSACADLVSEMSTAYEAIPAALDSPEYHEAAELLDRVAQLADGIVDDLRSASGFLDEMTSLSRGVGQAAQAMPGFVRTMRALASVARIVVAGVGSRNNDLAVFSEGMKTLAERIAKLVEDFEASYSRMGHGLKEARALGAPLAAKNTRRVADIRAELDTALAQMDRQRRWAADQAAAHSERSARIWAELARAVEALQVGDRTRQRTEHVEQGLNLLAEAGDRATAVAGAAMLSAQLEDAVRAFEEEIATVKASLSALLRETDAMLESVVRDAAAILSAGGEAFGMIDQSLDRVGNMLKDSSRAGDELACAVQKLVASVGELSGYMRDFDGIGAEVDLCSLNGAIKSRALESEGRAFRTVAEEIRTLARDMVPAVKAVTERLTEASQLLDRHAAENAGDQSATPRRREIVAGARERIEAVSARLREKAGSIDDTGSRAAAALRDALAVTDDRQGHCARWRAATAELERWVAEAGGAPAPSQCDQALLARVFGLYTMQAERDVHCRFFSAPAGWVQPAAPKPDDEALDDIFF